MDQATVNATKQAEARRMANEELKTSGPRIQAAQQATAKASSQIQGLEAKLAEAKQRVTELEAQKTTAHQELHKDKVTLYEAKQRTQVLREEAQGKMGGPPEHGAWLLDELAAFPHQNLLALVAGALGVYSVVDPQYFLKVLSVGVFGATAGAVGTVQFQAYMGETSAGGLSIVVGIEVAAVVAFAAVMGFAGVQLLIGAVTGLMLAVLTADSTIVSAIFGGEEALWYVLCLTAGVVSIYLLKNDANTVLGAVIGGLLVASSLSFFVAELVVSSNGVTSWVEFVRALENEEAASKAFGEGSTAVQMTELTVWVVITSLSLSCWYKGWPKSTRPSEPLEIDTPVPALRVPLLEENVEAMNDGHCFKGSAPSEARSGKVRLESIPEPTPSLAPSRAPSMAPPSVAGSVSTLPSKDTKDTKESKKTVTSKIKGAAEAAFKEFRSGGDPAENYATRLAWIDPKTGIENKALQNPYNHCGGC
ncbi:unnamed protein product [Polarella glacialis]|nr:unnamed protein product [Polarella glacialis]